MPVKVTEHLTGSLKVKFTPAELEFLMQRAGPRYLATWIADVAATAATAIAEAHRAYAASMKRKKKAHRRKRDADERLVEVDFLPKETLGAARSLKVDGTVQDQVELAGELVKGGVSTLIRYLALRSAATVPAPGDSLLLAQLMEAKQAGLDIVRQLAATRKARDDIYMALTLDLDSLQKKAS